MDQSLMMKKIEDLLDEARAAVLTGIDLEGKPFARWMTPVTLKDRQGAIYAVTSPGSPKLKRLEQNPCVEWLIQPPSLREILTLQGKVNVLTAPSIRGEVMQKLAGRLNVFWKVSLDRTDFVVLETIVCQGSYFVPMRGTIKTVTFGEEDE